MQQLHFEEEEEEWREVVFFVLLDFRQLSFVMKG